MYICCSKRCNWNFPVSYVPLTFREMEYDVAPSSLMARHMYWPASSCFTSNTSSWPEMGLMKTRPSVSSCLPSLIQMIVGVGSPELLHCRRTVLPSTTLNAVGPPTMTGGAVKSKRGASASNKDVSSSSTEEYQWEQLLHAQQLEMHPYTRMIGISHTVHTYIYSM